MGHGIHDLARTRTKAPTRLSVEPGLLDGSAMACLTRIAEYLYYSPRLRKNQDSVETGMMNP